MYYIIADKYPEISVQLRDNLLIKQYFLNISLNLI